MKNFGKAPILYLARRSKTIQRLSAFIATHAVADTNARDTYGYLKQKFIENGRNHDVGEETRREIVARFETIDLQVPIASTPTDGLFLAEMLLNLSANGALLECGCYAGGSSAKLSIIAKLLNRNLLIFDSFEGLPITDEYYVKDQHCRRSGEWVSDWAEGRYATRAEEVRKNIEKYGEFAACKFIKGWFSDTLIEENLPQHIGFAFVDVDLASSARDCFVALWPRIPEQGIYITHDAAYVKVLLEFYKPELWTRTFKAVPPILFGAGYGLCNDSPHLGYMVQGSSLTPEYLKSLTIDK